MNRTEKVLHTLGRLRGAYERGIKGVDAQFSDPRAWVSAGGFGGVGSAGKGKRPESPSDAIDNYFTSWTYIFSSIKAQAVASVPLRTYGALPTKGKRLKWAGTDIAVPSRPVSRARIKEFTSSLALMPYMTKAEDVEELVDYPLNTLLQSPNPFSSTTELMALTSLFLDLAGESYWYLVKNGAGVPEAIWLMPSQYVTPIPGETLDEFITGYKFQRGQSSVVLPFADVIHFNYPNPKNQIVGMSPVVGVADAVYNNSQMNIYEASLFENKARVDGLFEVDSTVPMAQVERAKEKFASEFAGTQVAGKRPLLPPGMKFTKTSMTAEEISFIEGRKLSREEIAGGLNFPIALIDPNSIRANVDAGGYFLAKYGIEPIHKIISGGINKYLVPMYDNGGSIFVEFDSAVPDDRELALRERIAGVGSAAYLTIDEARQEVGKDPLDIPGVSDVPLVSALLQPLGTEPPPPAPNPFAVPAAPVDEEADADAAAKDLAERTMKALKERLS